MIDDDEADDKFEEAKKAIKTSVLLWLPQYQVGIINRERTRRLIVVFVEHHESRFPV